MIFILSNFHFKKIGINKICYEYINLGDGGHIRIVWSCRNAVKKTQCLICFIKKNGNWSSSCQNFNQIYSNSLEENEEENEPTDIEFTEQKAGPEIVRACTPNNFH